jgi:cytochrome c oxidase cbb3-type subunit I/II
MYFSGFILCLVNLYKTKLSAPFIENNEKVIVPARFVEAPITDEINLATDASSLRKISLNLHRLLESKPLSFAVLTMIAVLIGGIIEIVPTLMVNQFTPVYVGAKPYTPLELHGRDIYIREGCYNCHSQMIRPFRDETLRYGRYSEPQESAFDHPFQWGSRRIGPDLARVGGKYPDLWHYRHLQDPRLIASQSVMPSYAWILKAELDTHLASAKVNAMKKLGVPYTDDDVKSAEENLNQQARRIASQLKEQGLREDISGKEVVALIAYLQRLGTDLQKQTEKKVGQSQ